MLVLPQYYRTSIMCIPVLPKSWPKLYNLKYRVIEILHIKSNKEIISAWALHTKHETWKCITSLYFFVNKRSISFLTSASLASIKMARRLVLLLCVTYPHSWKQVIKSYHCWIVRHCVINIFSKKLHVYMNLWKSIVQQKKNSCC